MRSFEFKIADICYLLQSSDEKFNEAIAEKYGDFSSDDNPDIEINIFFLPCGSMQRGINRSGIKFVSNNDGRVMRVFLEAKELRDMMLHFNAMLHFIMQHANCILQRKQFLFHAGGVSYEGQGLVFTGPAETGKTTTCGNIADHVRGAEVINDELIVIAQEDNRFMIHNTPLRQDYGVSHRLSVPLSAIYKLKQSEEVKIRPLERQETIDLVNNQSVPPGYQLQGLCDNADSKKALFAGIAEKVDCYELSLKPDISFWDCVMNGLANR